jgi:hypothetical protein
MESIRDGCVWRGERDSVIAQVFKEPVLMEPAQRSNQCRECKAAAKILCENNDRE